MNNPTANEILENFGVELVTEKLTDGSMVYAVSTSLIEIPCRTEEAARQLSLAIAVAIRNYASL